jgi:hypothetical protein
MALYRLLVGQHLQADPDWEPSKMELKAAEASGIDPKPPTRTYSAGQLVESETDLVAKCGSEKFQLVSGKPTRKVPSASSKNPTPGDPTPEVAATSPAKFPQGQVSTGHQGSTTNPQGETVTGPVGDESFVTGRGPQSRVAPDAGVEEPAAEEESGDLEVRYGNFDEMHVDDLKQVAEAEEIELKGATRKADIIKVLRKASK